MVEIVQVDLHLLLKQLQQQKLLQLISMNILDIIMLFLVMLKSQKQILQIVHHVDV